MTPISVIFAGTPEFAVPSLEALLADSSFDVQGVITQPDKPVGRSGKLTPPPVKVVAEGSGIPVWQPKNINTEWQERGSGFSDAPDFLVVVAYGQILGRKILKWPRIAPVNVHASLLPRWRGASPIQQALLEGDGETGITIQRMVERLDAGPILAQERIEIAPKETSSSLGEKLSSIGASVLTRTLNNPLSEKEQDEAKATHCHKLSRDSGIVDPESMTAEQIDRAVRALVPWPGVRCTFAGEEVKLIETSLEERADAVPLPCKNSTLYLLTVLPPGKRAMPATDWFRGKR